MARTVLSNVAPGATVLVATTRLSPWIRLTVAEAAPAPTLSRRAVSFRSPELGQARPFAGQTLNGAAFQSTFFEYLKGYFPEFEERTGARVNFNTQAFPVYNQRTDLELSTRGSALDVFGYTEERRGERARIGEYQRTVSSLLDTLDAGNVALAAEIASIPEHIRGYGHVKHASLGKAKAREAELLAEWNARPRTARAA